MIQYIFTFSGRMNRKPYWIGTIFITLGVFLPLFLFGVLEAMDLPSAALIALGILAAIPFILALIASASFAIRRLHDRNKGWGWFAFLYGLPVALAGVAGFYNMAETDPTNIVSGVLSAWAFIELGFFRGTRGGNQYGPDPLTGDVVDARAFD